MWRYIERISVVTDTVMEWGHMNGTQLVETGTNNASTVSLFIYPVCLLFVEKQEPFPHHWSPWATKLRRSFVAQIGL